MASAAVDVGTGLTITFASSFCAQIVDMSWSGISRVSIPTSHMGTAAPDPTKFGNMTFMPGDLSDPGELSVELHFNPDTEPPIDQVAEAITVTYNGGATWVTSGFMTNFEVGTPLEDKMTGSATLKISGNVTITGG